MTGESERFLPDVIIERIASPGLLENGEINKLKSEILIFLETMVEDNLKELLNKRNTNDIYFSGTSEFFRKRNRYRATRKLIHYLVNMLDIITRSGFPGFQEADHFREFRKLVLFQSDLLREPDVLGAIEQEFEGRSVREHISLWYYKGIIRSVHNEIDGLISQSQKPAIGDYRNLLEALKQISSFWFYVRKEDEKRIRRTDTYMYQLVFILTEKLKG